MGRRRRELLGIASPPIPPHRGYPRCGGMGGEAIPKSSLRRRPIPPNYNTAGGEVMVADDLAEDVAVVGGDAQVAGAFQVAGGEAGPLVVDLPAADAAAEEEHGGG